MRRLHMLMLVLAWTACSDGGRFDPDQVEREAQSFMESYARDLLNHDVTAIADRYDRRGAYFLGNGRKSFDTFDAITARYRDAWQGPVAFEWHDLSFDVISADAVMVAGRFSWILADTIPAIAFSYAGLLVRQDGQLRVRLEDESLVPAHAPIFMEHRPARTP